MIPDAKARDSMLWALSGFDAPGTQQTEALPEWARHPDWAKKAAGQFEKRFTPPANKTDAYQVGWIVGLLEGSLPGFRNALTQPGFASVFEYLEAVGKFAREAVSKEPLAVGQEFYDGTRSGLKKAEELDALPYTQKIYVVMFALSSVFAQSTKGEVHRWLVKHKVVTSDTDSSQTRQLLKRIDFPCGRPGRRPSPKKGKPE